MKNQIQTTALAMLLCMFTFFTKAQSQTVNVSLTPPSEVGACRQNLYNISFTGAAAGTMLRIVPSLNFASSTQCPSTDGVALQFVNATNATLVSDGDTLIVSANNSNTITMNYYVLIDCHIIGNSSIILNQTFLSDANGTNFIVDNDNIYTTTNIKSPVIALQNTTNFHALYLTNSYFYFYYRNNGDSANIRFSFTPSPTGYCGQVITDSIFYQNGLEGTPFIYTGTAADTLQLAHFDTLVIKQRVYVSSCISSCQNDTAKFSWQCNYTMPQANNFCSNCAKDTFNYAVTNNDSAQIDVIRLSPVKADREFSCFNDTANAITWKYMIVNTGRGAIDSVNFEFKDWGTSLNTAVLNHLMLIDSASFSIKKGITSGCTIAADRFTRTQWLCSNLITKALHHADIKIKNFGQSDTVYLSFTTLRCSEENDAALLNRNKIYNQWYFNNLRAIEKCGRKTDITATNGLFGAFISGQTAGSNLDDINLKLQYFPSVSNLSVDNSGNGDSATFSMQLKGLVKNTATNIYQLLGCDTIQSLCDTLYGWMRATVFCDSNIRITRPWQDVYFIKINTNGDTAFFNPEYYYTSDTIGYSVCRRTSYYFYFNLADSAMRSVLDSGNFVFKIQACCGSDLSPSPYSVTFHLLPNPNNCFALQYTGSNFAGHLTPPVISNNSGEVQWLPLSDKRKDITVLCPGCLSPGIIAHSYKMQRAQSSIGLQDSDNDGKADFPPIQITDTSAWFAQHTQFINRNQSGFGDKVEDFLLSNFVDGDKNNGGYDYGQLQQLGLRFNVLQLSRFIPLGLDTMMLTPDSLVFYIDDTSTTSAGCLDCDAFSSGNGYNTLIKLTVGPNDIADFFVGTSLTYNEYRFAFTSFYDSVSNIYSGTLHDHPANIAYNSNTFTGFLPLQHYRLRVYYNVCGNFTGSGNLDIDSYVKPSQIINRMFFSGMVHQTPSGLIPQQPNTTALLDSVGWTVNPNDASNMLADTVFMNQYAFFCETTGAIHFFTSTEYENSTLSANNNGCKKLLRLVATSNITGGKSIYDAYPYEYKTPLLMPVSFNVNVPFGYYVAGASVKNLVFVTPANTASYSDTVALYLTDTIGNIIITQADLPPLNCFYQQSTQTANDTLFFGDQYNSRSIDLTLLPLPQLCVDTLVLPAIDTTCVIGFNVQSLVCLQSGSCSQANLTKGNKLMNALGINPDLAISGISNSFVLLNSDTICWSGIKIENINSAQPALTLAENVYLALIDSSPPYLSDWHFIKGAQVIYPNGNVFAIAPALAKGTSVTGDLCARVANCPADTLQKEIKLHYGWNCNNFPASPYDSTKICEFASLYLTFKKAETEFYTLGKSYETPYTLCDTTTVSATFYSTQLGYVYPDSLLLQNLNPSLMVAGVSISANGNTAQLLPTLQPWLWLFIADSMAKIGFNEGGFNNGSQFILQVDLVAGCTFSGDTTLPNFNIYAHDYCGNAVDANADYRLSPVFQMSTVQSQCPDCWSITKTASTDTVAVGDTLSYTIAVCNNSANAQTATLADNTPANFIITNSTLPITVALNSMQCDTFTVTGYFTSPGSCFYNVATVTSPANTIWKDSVCVSVTALCNIPNAITLPDSSFSLPLNTNYSSTDFVVQGRFYVDDTLTLINCHVYTNPGAQIIVLPTGLLTLDGTTIEGCTQMWRGVRLNKNAKIIMRENSTIMDADTGITALHGSAFDLRFSRVINCVVGIAVPKQAGMNNVQAYVNGCKFGLYATTFKPDYAGQNAHHAMPRSCMEFNDVVMTIGDKDTNEFRNSNWGIYSMRSDLTVKTSRFRKMVAAGSLYGTATHKGTAVVAESKTAATAGMITFTNSSIDSCVYGTYTEWTTARVYSINAAHVAAVGSYHLYCNSTGMSTTVNNCNITAGKAGITFQNSERATMTAAGNAIKVTAGGSSVGINIISTTTNFGNYQILNNPYIEAVQGSGIVANNAKNANVINNFVKLSGNTSNGISLTGCDSSTVSCNNVIGRYPAVSYQNKGINSSMNRQCYFSCNITDSTYRGANFVSTNLGTKFRGNEMKKHYIGLYLDNTAVIDTQSHAGNLWTGAYSSTYGAWNENDSLTSNLFASLFIVNPSLGAFYNPNIPLGINPGEPNDQGWFDQIVGVNAFECSGYLLCTNNPNDRENSSNDIKEAIAEDSTISSEYIQESKSTAKIFLFEDIKDDSLQYSNNSVLMQFLNDNENSTFGKLKHTKEFMKEAFLLNSSSESVLETKDSLLNIHRKNLQNIDSLAAVDSTINNLADREIELNIISDLALQKISLISLLNKDAKLFDAKNVNDGIQPNELPEYNLKQINRINIAYKQNENKDSISTYYSDILNIAEQCPQSGGVAVYIARSLLALFNDSIIYDDDDICFQQGYYRISQTKNERILNPDISIVPNPADEKTIIKLNKKPDGICKVIVTDAYSKIVLVAEFDCKQRQLSISTKGFSQGVYFIKININENFIKSAKLIIAR